MKKYILLLGLMYGAYVFYNYFFWKNIYINKAENRAKGIVEGKLSRSNCVGLKYLSTKVINLHKLKFLKKEISNTYVAVYYEYKEYKNIYNLTVSYTRYPDPSTQPMDECRFSAYIEKNTL